jgi:hypothetical protein
MTQHLHTAYAKANGLIGLINLSGTRGARPRTGTFSCSETPTLDTAVARTWTPSCPAAATDLISAMASSETRIDRLVAKGCDVGQRWAHARLLELRRPGRTRTTQGFPPKSSANRRQTLRGNGP